MTILINKARCATCFKENAIMKCEGCSQPFCYNHVTDHRQELNKQLEEVEVTCNVIRQTIAEQINHSQKHLLLQKINEWEEESIRKVQDTAKEARQLLVKYTMGPISEMQVKLNKVTEQLRQGRQENDFYEKDLRRWQEQLIKLEKELPIKPSRITVRHDTEPFITKIAVTALIPQLSLPLLNNSRKWMKDGNTIAGGNGQGHEVSQLYNPLSVCVDDDDQTVYIADYWNNRIVKWTCGATSGQIVLGGTIQSNKIDQLNCPKDVILDKENDCLFISDTGNRQVVRWSLCNGIQPETIISDIDCWGLAIDNHGYLYVSDYIKHEVRRWRIDDTTDETIVAGGNGQGTRYDQLDCPTHIFVDHEQSVYISDRFNHRIMKWKLNAKQGIIVAGCQTEGKSEKQLSHPTGIVVDQFGSVYVADSNNDRIMRWPKGATKGTIVVGGNGHGEKPNQLYNPWGLSFDQQGNLYVADNFNHRIQKFQIDLSRNYV